jgi:catechol 2,3-dioxygenase-like lactoylglutathione lyase family enzyme
MIKNIRHTGIVVDDLNKSLDFYTKKLGFKVSNRMDESGSFLDKVLGLNNVFVTTIKMTLGNGQMVELLDFSSHKKAALEKYINDIGPTHMAFTVNNLDAIYIDFKDDGVEFISKPEISSNGYAKVAFCKAPEGTFIELVQLMER